MAMACPSGADCTTFMRKVLMKIWSKILLLALAANLAFAFSAQKLVQDARAQIGQTLFYDPSYSKLAYPMGDVDMIKGVCTNIKIGRAHV